MLYPWIKSIHIIAMVAWMAGLFYLPRLFVYHAREAVGGHGDGVFKIMERRLMNAIMRPALILTLIAGVGTVQAAGISWGEGWLSAKLAAVLLMVGYHGLLEAHTAQFARGERRRTETYFRIINEVPTVLLIFIVIMVVVKPF